jgi:acyl-CoA synthetase (NDP forming)
MLKALRTYIPPAGNMIKNPLDAFFLFLDESDHLERTMDLFSESRDVNMLILSLHLDWVDSFLFPTIAQRIKTVCVERLRGKPFVVCWRQIRDDPKLHQEALDFEKDLLDSGIPVYRSFETAALSLSKLVEYHLSKNEAQK